MSQQLIDENEDTVCCFGFCPSKKWTLLEIEEAFDDNDHDIIFKKKNSSTSTNLPNKPITFYCSRSELGNNCFLLRKISSDRNTFIILTYQGYHERILLDGFLMTNCQKFKVTDFKPRRIIKDGENTYEWVTECTYEPITTLESNL
jgi:hypothetical protein